MLLLLVGVATAQSPQGEFKKTKRAKASQTVSASPVTQAEAKAIFSRIEQSIKKVLKLQGSKQSAIRPVGAPATRSQIVEELDRLVRLSEAQFSLTPVAFTGKANLVFKATDVKEKAKRLIELGFVPASSPLITNKADTMTPTEFGDALGYFLGRLAELSHTPSSKFTPYLADPEG